jgi:L-lysine 6-transaminase
MAHFVSTFKRVAVPDEFKHLFLIEGGSAAVENTLKTAFDWKVRWNFARGEKAEKGTKIIHFKEAFHGRGGYTLSLTNTDDRKIKYFPKFDWPRITNPKITFPLNETNLAAVRELECHAAREIEQALTQNSGDIAAIILETIQGEGGDNHYRPEFFSYLREVANKHEVLLIFDEVQSGMGITGKMWAYQHSTIKPDIISFGKKAQVCGMLATDRIDQVKDNVFEETSRINSTWGGNLTDMVRAGRYLEIMEEDRLVENAASVGAYLLKKLDGLVEKYPQLFSNARGRGLMCSIDMPNANIRDRMLDETYNRGLLVLKCGVSGLRLRPALIFSTPEVDELIGIIEESAKAL